MSEKVQKKGGKKAHASKLVAIIVILAVGIFGMKYLKENGPKADKEAPPVVVPVVRAVVAQSTDE
ncbi:MAG: hypothetical protein KJO79_05535, partial [Verrucomicrobiae bacterium]|nr:hypothetical protein [Verrucomicrobiae bacterium]NNJ86623.1 hypothetical protein [Akkermansiaceae bacterium]